MDANNNEENAPSQEDSIRESTPLPENVSKNIDDICANMGHSESANISFTGFNFELSPEKNSNEDANVEPMQSTSGSKPSISPKKKINCHSRPKKRPKQNKIQFCILCRKQFTSLRQHFAKSHQLTCRQRKFLLSFYRTRICKSPVYECRNCLIRLTNKKKHKGKYRDHRIVSIREKDDLKNFPPEFAPVLTNVEKQRPPPTSFNLVSEFDAYRRSAGSDPLSTFLKNFIFEILRQTSMFKKPEQFRSAVAIYKLKRKYTHVTIRKLLFLFKDFIEYCRNMKQKQLRFPYSVYEGEVKSLLKKHAKEGRKETKTRAALRFERMPSLKEVAIQKQKVLELLQDQSVSSNMTYYEMLPMVVFLILADCNCRLGTIINETYEDYEALEVGGVRISHKHKTGDVLPNFFEKTPELVNWISTLHEKLRQESGIVKPRYMVPSKKNDVFESQCRYLARAFQKYFKIDDLCYGPNSVRKAWETQVAKENLFSENIKQLYVMNTGHSVSTRADYYVKPVDKEQVKDLLRRQRELLNCPGEITHIVPEEQSEQQDADAVSETATTVTIETNPQPQTSGDTEEDQNQGFAETPTDDEEAEFQEDDFLEEDDFNDPECQISNNEDLEPPGTSFETNPTKTVTTRRDLTCYWEKVRQRMLTFKGTGTCLRPSIRRLCELVCKKRCKLDKGNIRDIAMSLNLPHKDQEKVIDACYSKFHNVLKSM